MSKVSIGRQTLSMIGRSGIESFEEESPEARQLKEWFDPARKEALAAYNFSFARRTAALALHPTPPLDTWQYRYTYPAGALRIWKVFVPGTKKAQPYEIALVGEELTILTDVSVAHVTYTFDLEVTTLFSSYFIKALRYLLAHYIAPNLNGEAGISSAAGYLTAHRTYLAEAAVNDANNEFDREEDDPAVIRVR